MRDSSFSSDNRNTYYQLKFGDVIWANRALSLKNGIDNVPCGHREGPYIVIGYKNGNIIAFYATSVKPRNEVMRSCSLFVPLKENSESGLVKDTYVDVHRVINLLPEQFISYMGTLSLEERHLLKKKIDVLTKKGFHVLDYISKEEVPLEKGDIVWYEKGFHLILEKRKRSLIATELKEEPSEKYSTSIEASGISYYFDSNSVVGIKRDCKPVRVSFVETDSDLAIVDKMANRIEELSAKVKAKKGSVVAYKQSLFYVYDENDEYWKTFRVYVDNGPDLISFKVEDRIYYTDFLDDVDILKWIVLHRAVSQSTLEDITNLNEIRKKYEDNNKFKYGETKFKPGDIVVDRDTRSQEFLVILTYPDKMIVVKKEDMYTRDYHLLDKNYKGYSIIGSLNGMMLRDILMEIQETDISKRRECDLKTLTKIVEGGINHY